MLLIDFDDSLAAGYLSAQCDLHTFSCTESFIFIKMFLEKLFVLDLYFIQLGIGTIRVVMEQYQGAHVSVYGELERLSTLVAAGCQF